MQPLETQLINIAGTQIGVREATGHNDGQAVETYLASVGLGKGYSWCMAFVYWCAKQASTSLGLQNPLKQTAGVLDEWQSGRGTHITEPFTGSIFIMDFGGGEGHTGIVTGVFHEQGIFHSIEGNAQPLSAKVLTPNGFKKMGELKLGDLVIDPKGEQSYIIGIFPKGKRDIFKITLQDGSSTTACDEHLWLINHDGCKTKVVNTLKIKHTIENTVQKYRVPIIEPVVYTTGSKLPIDPYLLGLLLGDGTFGDNHIGFTNIDEEIINYVQSSVLDINQKFVSHVATEKAVKGNWRITNNQIDNSLLKELEKVGLKGKRSIDKFIPEVYKKASIYERLSLLQGLMDSDGHIDKIGRIEFCSCSLQLSKDTLEIINSLGGRASINIKENIFYTSPTQKNKKKAKDAYRLQNINMPFYNIFRLKRKADRFKKRNTSWQRRIVSVEKIGHEDVQCISVSAVSSLYITDDFIPTHNTNDDGSREGIGVFRRTREINDVRIKGYILLDKTV